MKKFLLPLLALTLLLSGCGKGNANDPTDPSGFSEATEIATTSDSDKASMNDFDGSGIFTNERSYAVMIDNDGNSSRPHAGIEDAYLIYEMYVEGEATRLMALFKGVDTQKIGPVRSSRHYFLDYVLDNDAMYSHAGYSPLALSDLSALNINNLNGLVYEPTYYWRERKYSGDYHSLYTSISNLSSLADKLNYRKTSDVLPFSFSDEAPVYQGKNATDITIPYASFYYVGYKYNEETGLYDRYINSEHHSTQSGTNLSAKQIIFQFAKSYPLGDGSARIQLDTVGSGKGVFISNGSYVPVTWKKTARDSQLKFYTEDGKELVLDSTGPTYVQVMPSSLNYKIN